MTAKPEGESKLLELKRQAESLREHPEESRRAEAEQLVAGPEQQWRALLEAANQAGVRSLSVDFDVQSKNTEVWIGERRQRLQAVGGHTVPAERCHTAQVCVNATAVQLWQHIYNTVLCNI